MSALITTSILHAHAGVGTCTHTRKAGVSRDAIRDILGVDKRMLRYYIKAVQEKKKKVPINLSRESRRTAKRHNLMYT